MIESHQGGAIVLGHCRIHGVGTSQPSGGGEIYGLVKDLIVERNEGLPRQVAQCAG
jgi:hypothetical protein